MRLVKLVLFAALVAGWWQLWHASDEVVAAYIEDRPALELELGGLDAAIDDDQRPVSPFAFRPASGERTPTHLPLADPLDADEVPPDQDQAGSEEPAPDPPDADGPSTDEPDEAGDGGSEEEAAAEPELEEEPAGIRVTGGEAMLAGTVQLADGTPVAGATIRIERFTSDGQGAAQTVSGPDGSWTAEGLRGGRLRIRAFAPGQLASVDAVVLIVARTGSATVPLSVRLPDPGLRFEMVGPPGIAIGTVDTAAIVVSRQTVDERGRLVEVPVVGQRFTAVIAAARLLSADEVTTDDGGAMRFLLACDGPSEPLATMVDGDERSLVALPPCLSAEALAELEAAAAVERANGQPVDQVVGAMQ